MAAKTDLKWYYRSWFLVLMLFSPLAPIGLVLMFVWRRYRPFARLILSPVFSGCAMFFIVFGLPFFGVTRLEEAKAENSTIRERSKAEQENPSESSESPRIRRLIATLGSKNSNERKRAGEALVAMQGDAVPALIRALKDENRMVRAEAAWALQKIGPAAKDAAPALTAALRDSVQAVRYQSAIALGAIGPTARDVVPDIIQALNYYEYADSGGFGTRRYIAKALGEILSKDAVPALKDALKDRDEYVRSEAAWALGEIGSEDAIPALEAVLENKEYRTTEAALALKKISPEKDIISILIEIAREGVKILDKDRAFNAIFALGQIGPAAKDAVPFLMQVLENSERKYFARSGAAKALGKIGAKNAIPVLRRVSKDKSRAVRVSSYGALWRLGDRAEVVKAIRYGDKEARWNAISGLGYIGSAAKDAIPVIEEAITRETDRMYRDLFQASLKKIKKSHE